MLALNDVKQLLILIIAVFSFLLIFIELRSLKKCNKLMQQLLKQEKLNHTDELTGINNRRAFVSKIKNICEAQAIQGCEATSNPLNLLMIDIDCFKAYNDRYGHLAGDQALITVAKQLEKIATEHNVSVSRWGGEEFVMLLKETDYERSLNIANQVRRSIEECNIPHATSELSCKKLTVSVGMAVFTPAVYNVELIESGKLIHLADNALYQAKKEGRNRVCVNCN